MRQGFPPPQSAVDVVERRDNARRKTLSRLRPPMHRTDAGEEKRTRQIRRFDDSHINISP
jgi:hypothetical protein